MAAGLPLLLRLPPCLRQQLLSREPVVVHDLLWKPATSGISIRSFMNGQIRNANARQKTPPPPKPRVVRPTTSTGSSKATVPGTSQGGASSTTPQPPKPHDPRPPVRPEYSKVPDILSSEAVRNAPSTLLYVAPKHGAFKFMSYLTGGMLLLGAGAHSLFILQVDADKELRTPWWLKSIGAASAICMAGFATTVFLGPGKLIKSISILRAARTANGLMAPRLLRVEVQRPFPWLKPDIVEVPAADITINKEVRAMRGNIKMHDIARDASQAFTAAYENGSLNSRQETRLMGALKTFINPWPPLKREVRRMCLRENMAYIQLKNNGNFKVDLHECYILDGGRPLAQLFKYNPNPEGVLVTYINRVKRMLS